MKQLKALFAVLLISTAVVGAFAFTPKHHAVAKKFTVVSFQYTGPNDPSDAQATTSSNYSSVTSLSGSSPFQTLDGIQFNTTDFPLNGSGQPDFTISDLATIVKAHKAPGTNGATFTINGKNVTFYYRSR